MCSEHGERRMRVRTLLLQLKGERYVCNDNSSSSALLWCEAAHRTGSYARAVMCAEQVIDDNNERKANMLHLLQVC